MLSGSVSKKTRFAFETDSFQAMKLCSVLRLSTTIIESTIIIIFCNAAGFGVCDNVYLFM